MKITHTSKLEEQQKQQLRSIVAQCCEAEDLHLSFPEEGEEFWILEENGQAASFFSICRTTESLWECSAFTLPHFRKKGYFSSLLDEVCRYSEPNGDPELCFVTDRRCPAALSVLQELGAQLFQEEYMMEYDLTALQPPQSSLIQWDQALSPEMIHRLSSMEEGEEYFCSMKDPASMSHGKEGQKEAPSFCLSRSSSLQELPVACRLMAQGGSVYLYSLYTLPRLRRQGLAYTFFLSLIPILSAAGFEKLRLQVSGSNEPAMKLYKKTGFHITETLSFYVY